MVSVFMMLLLGFQLVAIQISIFIAILRHFYLARIVQTAIILVGYHLRLVHQNLPHSSQIFVKGSSSGLIRCAFDISEKMIF